MHLRPLPRPPSRRGQRLQRLLTLDPTIHRDIYRDRSLTLEALGAALAVFFLSGLGGWLWLEFIEDRPIDGFFIDSVLIGTLTATGLFFVWVGIVAASVGVLGRDSGTAMADVLRTLAYATLPFALSFLIWVPGLAFPVTLTVITLLLVSMAQATQVVASLSFGRALGVNLMAFFLWASLLSSLMDSNHFAPGIFLWELFSPF